MKTVGKTLPNLKFNKLTISFFFLTQQRLVLTSKNFLRRRTPIWMSVEIRFGCYNWIWISFCDNVTAHSPQAPCSAKPAAKPKVLKWCHRVTDWSILTLKIIPSATESVTYTLKSRIAPEVIFRTLLSWVLDVLPGAQLSQVTRRYCSSWPTQAEFLALHRPIFCYWCMIVASYMHFFHSVGYMRCLTAIMRHELNAYIIAC